MTTTKTLRDLARESVLQQVAETAKRSHWMNYHRLHVYRDGEVRWTEHIDATERFIDDDATDFSPVASAACVGTGAFRCNCDHCEAATNGQYASLDEAIDEAVNDTDLTPYEDQLGAEFSKIPAGYFDDEEAR